MSCVLRVLGENLDIDGLLVKQKPIPVATWKNGEERLLKGLFHVNSSANFDVSDAGSEELSRQISDAELYLARNSDEIMKIMKVKGLEEMMLDFSISTRPGFVTQTRFFPAKLLK